jgi:lipoprotein-releasing system permease protein
VVFRVGGIFHIGFDLYDDQLAYVTLTTMQGLRGRGDTVTGVEIRVKDLDRNGAIAHELDAKLGGPPYEVDDVLLLNADLVDH